MSEEAKEAPAKKKGKMPIILALVVVLGGGGFFMMKGKGEKPPEPPLELAEKEVELEEILCNTSNPNTYVRAKLAIKFCKTWDSKPFTEEIVKGKTIEIRDAAIAALNTISPQLLNDGTKRAEVRAKVCEAINVAVAGPKEEREAMVEGLMQSYKKASKGHKKANKGKGHEEEDDDDPSREWDSKTGPILMVRFTNLATQ